MSESFEKKHAPAQQHQGFEGEEAMRTFLTIQKFLALRAYVDHHSLRIDPDTFVRRHDPVAEKIKNNAVLEWVTIEHENEPPLAASLARYWQRHEREMRDLDLSNPAACDEFVEKVRELGRQLRGKIT